jgi:signal transduction histidine kinase
MDLQPASNRAAVNSDLHRGTDTHLHGPWLALIRLAYSVLSVLAFIIFIASLAVYFADQQKSYSVGYAVFRLILGILVALVWFIVAVLIFWRKANDWLALLVSLMLVLLGAVTTIYPLDNIPSLWLLPAVILSMLSFLLLFLVLCLFPTGRFVPRWTGWLVVMLAVLWLGVLMVEIFDLLPKSFNSLFDLVLYCILGSCVFAQLYRYHSVSSRIERQQTKWIVFGVTATYLIEFALNYGSALFPLFSSTTSLANMILLPLGNTVPLLIPLSFGFAILRYRLWDIDIIIRRTLIYGMLTAFVVSLYVLVVVGLGALLQTRGNLGLSILATGLIAVLIQPLHTRLQRAVNHLLYGERDEPYKVISRLGRRLEATLAPEAVLPTIVETVTGALKLPFAAISLKQDGEDVMAASSGQATDELTHLPLVYQGEHLGDLLLAPRARGETFSSADRALLTDLTRQAGIAVHSVRLTTDLQRLTDELQHSRTQLVTAREEERRRLRRDLLDGLGSVLASLNWRAGALRLVLSRDPAAADALVVEQQTTIQAAIGDIRRLVYDLRPPALDELGLIGAIRERAAKQSAPAERDNALGMRVEVVAPDQLPALPAAVEVAAYRIMQEALTNVVRHAKAHRCYICLSCEQDLLQVEVSDDGIGLQESSRAGIGVLSMRERAAELGGTCEIIPLLEGGTCVRACLPLLKHDEQM